MLAAHGAGLVQPQNPCRVPFALARTCLPSWRRSRSDLALGRTARTDSGANRHERLNYVSWARNQRFGRRDQSQATSNRPSAFGRLNRTQSEEVTRRQFSTDATACSIMRHGDWDR